MKKILLSLAVAASFLLIAVPASSAEKPAKGGKSLYVYIPSEYIPDSVVNDFTKETGIKVSVSTYENLEDLSTKIRITKGKGYDVIMASIEYMSMFIKMGFLEKLDKAQLSNFKDMNPRFMGLKFDKNNDYTIPFFWGTSSFAVNSKKVDLNKFRGFEDLKRPEFKGRILLLKDSRAVLAIGERLLGYSINETSEDKIKAAAEKVKEILPNVKALDTEAGAQAILNGEVDIAQTWSGLAYSAHAENSDIVYVHPKEGISAWTDNFSVLSASENKENAYKFLNYLLRPEVIAKIAEEYQYSMVSLGAQKLLPEEMRDSPILNLTNSQWKKTEIEQELGDSIMTVEKYWTEILSVVSTTDSPEAEE